MKNFHGPYFSHSGEEVWHWRKDCPNFPVVNYISLISSAEMDKDKLCLLCVKLEEDGKNIGSPEPIKSNT